MLICSKDEFFGQFCIYLQICVLLLLFVFQKLEKIATKRDSVTGVFLWILQSFANFIIEHIRRAASETVTENSLKNSARIRKLHIISSVEVWLCLCTEAYFQGRKMLKIRRCWNVKWLDCRVSQKELTNFYESQNHILTLNYYFARSITLNRSPY